MSEASPNRLIAVSLDTLTLGPGTPDQEHERRTAIYDLLDGNRFEVEGHAGPYSLVIALYDNKLALQIRTGDGAPAVTHLLSLRPMRGILRDYMMLCDSYVEAIRSATPSQIEAIDMGRRGLHDEAAERLADRLSGKIKADFDTMRRLFTLITALHRKS